MRGRGGQTNANSTSSLKERRVWTVLRADSSGHFSKPSSSHCPEEIRTRDLPHVQELIQRDVRCQEIGSPQLQARGGDLRAFATANGASDRERAKPRAHHRREAASITHRSWNMSRIACIEWLVWAQCLPVHLLPLLRRFLGAVHTKRWGDLLRSFMGWNTGLWIPSPQPSPRGGEGLTR